MSLAPRCSPGGTELNTNLPSASASAVKLKLKSYKIEFEKITVSFIGGNLKIPRNVRSLSEVLRTQSRLMIDDSPPEHFR
jgi:hypothetical protein